MGFRMLAFSLKQATDFAGTILRLVLWRTSVRRKYAAACKSFRVNQGNPWAVINGTSSYPSIYQNQHSSKNSIVGRMFQSGHTARCRDFGTPEHGENLASHSLTIVCTDRCLSPFELTMPCKKLCKWRSFIVQSG
jgi:hypothetical protein